MNPRTPKPIKRPAGFKPNNQQLKTKNKIKYFTRDPQRKDVVRDPFETYSGNISDYYFVDYQIVEPSPRWIRQPFVHKDDMKNIIRDIYMMQIDDEISVTDIRIQSERGCVNCVILPTMKLRKSTPRIQSLIVSISLVQPIPALQKRLLARVAVSSKVVFRI